MSSRLFSVSNSGYIAGIGLLLMTIIAILVFPSLKASPLHVSGIALIILLEVIVSLALYHLLESVNKILSVSMAISRILYGAVFAYALSKFPNIEMFHTIWDKSLLLFGIHLILLGILVYNSRFIPKWLGILLLLAAFGYVVDSTAKMLGYQTMISVFTFFGEVLFALWLVIKSRNLPS